MYQIKIPWRWEEMVQLVPSWSWSNYKSELPRCIRLQWADHLWGGRIAEMKPDRRHSSLDLKQGGLSGRATGVGSQEVGEAGAREGFNEGVGAGRCVFGHPKTPGEAEAFLQELLPLSVYGSDDDTFGSGACVKIRQQSPGADFSDRLRIV